MGKHIIDGPRKGDDGERMKQYTRLDKEKSDQPGPQTEAKLRAPRAGDPGEKLKRFTDIERRGEE